MGYSWHVFHPFLYWRASSAELNLGIETGALYHLKLAHSRGVRWNVEEKGSSVMLCCALVLRHTSRTIIDLLICISNGDQRTRKEHFQKTWGTP